MMKFCPNCQVKVGRTFDYCPLCQNELIYKFDTDTSENQEANDSESDLQADREYLNEYDSAIALSSILQDPYFPDCSRLKTQSFWYKLQLFIMCAATFICFAVDFLITYDRDIHWSLIVLLWVVGFQILLNKLIKRHSLPSYFVFYIAVYIGVLLLPTAYYLGFLSFCVNYILPCICMTALILNFIFCMLDKTGNAMVYMLCNVLIGVLPSIIMIAIYGMAPLFWIICMITTVVSIFALVIFVGPKVRNEIIKRLNI